MYVYELTGDSRIHCVMNSQCCHVMSSGVCRRIVRCSLRCSRRWFVDFDARVGTRRSVSLAMEVLCPQDSQRLKRHLLPRMQRRRCACNSSCSTRQLRSINITKASCTTAFHVRLSISSKLWRRTFQRACSQRPQRRTCSSCSHSRRRH